MVLTVTLNAALDLTYEAERFTWGGVNRVDVVRGRAGGKGINVARTLAQLGREVVVTGLAGGATGAQIRAELAAGGLAERLVGIAGESRRTVVVHALADGTVTALNEPGPELAAGEWWAFVDAFAGLLEGARFVVLAGSLPGGRIPLNAYGLLAERCRARGVPVVVDASGAALLGALRERPALVKPNRDELEALGLGAADSDTAVRSAAEGLRERGAEAAVVTLGEKGLVAVTPEGAWRARGPAARGNPVGAGDAVTAALVDGWLAGRPWPERLRRAVAVGAATVRHPQAGSYDAAALATVEPDCVVEALP